ncbi:MAG: glycosyltransferase, partial [candidate division Zixibacteria bacterium]|nr:glycosyltransferase [candidate division Zixibacteria bacterium]
MEQISIIVPIIRPDAAECCVAAIKKNAGLPINQYEIVSGLDTHRVGCPKMVKKLVKKAKYDLIMFLGDDTVPEKDFLKNALKAMNDLPDGWGVVGLHTQDNRIEDGNPLAHWLAHRKILDYIPGGDFFSIEYAHSWGDNELRDIADEIGRWVWAEDSMITHVHPVNKSASDDKWYKKAYSDKNQAEDFITYCNRKRNRMKEK